MSKPNPFMVITTQRTGSSWLMETLNNVEGVEGHMELFFPYPRQKKPMAGCNDYSRYCEQTQLGRRPLSVFRYLNGLYKRPTCVGFKMMYGHIKVYPETLIYLIVKRMPIVHLMRDNYLDVLISSTLSDQTGRAHDTDAGEKTQVKTIELNPDTVVNQLKKLKKNSDFMIKVIKVMPCRSLVINYEKLREGDQEFQKLFAFLGLTTEVPGSKIVKRQNQAQSDIVANYTQISDIVAKAGFGDLLRG